MASLLALCMYVLYYACYSRELENKNKTLLTAQYFWGEKNTIIGTLRSENSDVHENVVEKKTLYLFKLFHDFAKSPSY